MVINMSKPVEKVIANTFMELASALETGSFGKPTIVLTGLGSEHGEDNMIKGAALAASRGAKVVYIGTKEADGVKTVHAKDEKEAHGLMESMLSSGEADGAVTMHYLFPIGVSTVGRVVTPGQGKAMYIATTTGTSSTDRVEGMVKNALYGIITAKACGVKNPTVGVLNVDGAQRAESALRELAKNGYDITFAESGRSDGGSIMRGNDMLSGTCDVLVTDSLTGNIIMKTMSSFTTGGSYESLGWGYGPGMGQGYDRLVLILSRASGTPVVAGAIEFASELAAGQYKSVSETEFNLAEKAGLSKVLSNIRAASAPSGGASDASNSDVKEPPKEPVTAEISGIEISDLDDAVLELWKAEIYAQSGMGCTGPVVMVNEGKLSKAEEVLKAKGFVG
jgi:hypothetical protein